jgi:hypothetical protein
MWEINPLNYFAHYWSRHKEYRNKIKRRFLGLMATRPWGNLPIGELGHKSFWPINQLKMVFMK